ncbi:WG repeat-containing protein [Paenibacillus sp. 1011MAR3C5]|uniref:WG repeat-containing protein n=1 Tax=Paenibacillus sp. 1011MAR3C5 TaxID=1675787 RepID=UPI0015FF77B3|nr:WG repeat-containing protein [Paenibacillus sp. 1011MAR3C5]
MTKVLLSISLLITMMFPITATAAANKAISEIIIQPQYDDITVFENGVAFVEKDGKWGLIDRKGTYVTPPQYENSSLTFTEGLADVSKNGKWGFIDQKGKEIIKPQFPVQPGDFVESRAAVSDGDYWGFINKEGNVVIDYQYVEVSNFYKGYALALTEDKGIVFLDKNGKLAAETNMYYVEELQYVNPYEYSDYVWLMDENGKWAFYSYDGKQIIQPTYRTPLSFIWRDYVLEQSNMFSEGKAIVTNDKYERFLIDEKGKATPILAAYKGSPLLAVGAYREGMVMASLLNENKAPTWGFLDHTGKEIVSPTTYLEIQDFSEGVAAVQNKAGTWGYINKKGQTVVPHSYDYGFPFNNGLAWVMMKGKWGMIDQKGKVVVPLKYEPLDEEWQMGDFRDGYVLVFNGSTYNFVNAKGEEVYMDGFEGAWHFSEGIGAIMVNGKWGYISKPADMVTAKSASAKVIIDGKEVAFEAYSINGNNYFKLRDLGMALSGTSKQFDVSYDAKKDSIMLAAGKAYTPVGGELATTGKMIHVAAWPTTSNVYLNGNKVELAAYKIGGNNYFKLRDIGQAFNFGITYDEAKKMIVIDTTKSYTE